MTFDLTSQWYNALIQNCNLNPRAFQLIQGSLAVGYTSEFLWNLLDTIPPKSINNYYTPSGSNLFSSNYGAILTNLDTELPLVKSALSTWKGAGGFQGTKAYNKTIYQLQQAIQGAPEYEFTMDSASESSDVTSTWAGGAQAVPASPFGAPKNSAVRAIPQHTRLTTKVKISHLMTFPAAPLSKRSTLNPDLKRFEPWFNAALLNLAVSNKKYWQRPSDWPTYFGPTGTMLRQCTGLIVADGIVTETTARAPVNSSETEELRQAVEASLSFVAFGSQPAMKPSKNAKGQSIFEINSPPGNLVILGVNVASIVNPDTEKGSPGLISVKNSGAFVATFSIQYTQDGDTRTVQSDNFPVLVAKTLQLPADATNILVTVKIATFIKTWSVVATYRYDKPPTKYFELTGTTFNPKCKEV